MDQMTQLAIAFLASEKHISRVGDESADALFRFLFLGNLYEGNYHSEIKEIRTKPINNLTRHEVAVYLTGLAKADRIYDVFDGYMQKGIIASLLKRWLELSKEENA